MLQSPGTPRVGHNLVTKQNTSKLLFFLIVSRQKLSFISHSTTYFLFVFFFNVKLLEMPFMLRKQAE